MDSTIYEVLIIGCGASGIGASYHLSQLKIPHLILESRSRMGGRIFTEFLDGVPLDMGAMVVHHPGENNSIIKIMKQLGWMSYNKKYDSKQIMIGDGRELSEEIKEKGYAVYREILEKLQAYAEKSEKDISFQQAMASFVQEKEKTEQLQVMNFVKLLLRIHGNIEGAQLSDISAKDLYVDDQTDVIPQHGYYKLLETIFHLHQRQTIFNQKVIQIKYEKEIIEVRTSTRTYHTRRLISSLPLGVLKSKSITFQPQLPQSKLKAIENMGLGVFNKVQVSFSEPFWDTSKQYILLVSEKEPFYRLRAFYYNNRYILCAYVSGESGRHLSHLNDEQIVQEFVACLRQFYRNARIQVKGYLVTRWEMDQHSLGSYSYYHVNRSSVDDVFELSKPIENKIWFVGEHCAPELTGSAHAAFSSGVKAAQEVAKSFNE